MDREVREAQLLILLDGKKKAKKKAKKKVRRR